MVFEMTISNKSVFIDRYTSHIKHGWQAKRMIMEYNACGSCALIGHNVPTVLQGLLQCGPTSVLPNWFFKGVVVCKTVCCCFAF